MPITYKYGEEEVKALAAQAGKAQAANIQLQQRFQKDMAVMDYQFKLAAEQRARAWDLEKMEIASRNDFQQEEAKRVERQQRWSLIKQQIDETQTLTPEQKEKALYSNYMKVFGGVVPKPKSIEDQKIEDALQNRQGVPGTAAQTQTTSQASSPPQAQPRSLGLVETPQGMQVMSAGGEMKPINQSGMVQVVNPSGERVKIKASQLQEAIAEGYQFIGVAATSMSQPVGPVATSEEPPMSPDDISFFKPPVANLVELFKAKEALRQKREKAEGPYDPGKRVRSGLSSVGKINR
jgi:hypothetical protein